MKRRNKYILTGLLVLLTGISYELEADPTAISSQFPDVEVVQDTVLVLFPVAPTIPSYEDLEAVYPVDLRNPVDFDRSFEYNPLTNRYELRSRIGRTDITTPISLTREEYLRYSLEKSMNAYFKSLNDDEFTGEGDRKRDALAGFGFNFDLGPADKIFGPGGVRLQPQGNITTKIGVTHTVSGDPTLTERQRNRWAFDFDPQIQASVVASIGDKMSFDLNYNTQSTFDYDAKKLKLAYAGKEDEILKVLEAGNVSMNTSNSLIRGGAALFGIKTQLQFGKLTVDALFSQQNSQSRSTSSRGSVQTVPFEIAVDNYDENMHFFIGHYFPDIYDEAMSKLPYIQSGILIDNIEVWITNKRSNYDQARNIVAFADLGEYHHISNPTLVRPEPGKEPLPDNRANSLYGHIVNNFPGARDISLVNQALLAGGFVGGQDYEKIENARKLETSEYTLNAQLGYIHLRMALQPDEALAVAYSYKYHGESYQVGEFSNDNPGRTSDNLYLKLIKGTSQSPATPGWPLMMRNVYTINQRGIEKDRFRLDIKYQNDTTGVYLNYITEGAIANQLLLSVENLDRLDSRNEPHADGFFDYVENFTILPSEGKIIFPVVEPFGKHLRKKIVEGIADAVAANAIADKYVYQELYDSTLTIARQTAEKNKFILAGEYKGSGGNNIALDGMNIARGSVVVSANGVRLKENQDYTVNYATGEVTIINPAYADANIQTSSENQSTFGMQRKTMMGVNLNYAFSSQFNLGATLMNLSEMPMTLKTGPGEESINNTLFGFNTNYTTRSQWLTDLVDKLPLIDLTEPSQISLNAEYAQLIPGHYRSKWGGDYSYIEDFERAKMTIDLRSPYGWYLSSTPSLFSESNFVNNIDYGKNRALLAWYYIDGLFTRRSSLTPTHIKNDDDQLSNHHVREVREEELFPNKDIRFDEASTIPVLNLAFYPKERGPYNLDALGMNPDGSLSAPEKRWGGVFRKIESGQTDFEANNIEHIEFWLLDPFIYEPGAQGGDLYFNLGEISEDILKDEKKFFENGLPVDGDKSKVEETVWGYIPKQQSQVYAFDPEGRTLQDVGLNGLSTEQEFDYPAYRDYLRELENRLPSETVDRMRQDPFSPFRDPAGDNYHYFRGSDYDREEVSILGRYKHYNGTEGNSANADDTNENYNTAAKISPDIEDINQDNTLNENEKYFQYRVSVRPQDMQIGRNFIVDKRISRPKLKNGKTEEVTWYQFKIPIREYESIEGNIRDFQSIRFMRMFLTHFSDSVILRFGTLELVRGDWRVYTKDLFNPNLPPSNDASISISTVNIEENGDKKPVNYIMPPGVNRMTDPGQTQLIQENEQSLAIKINHLSTGDARAVYKSEHLDTRQYKRFQLFVHAEKTEESPETLADNELSIFLRLGSDYKNNYYEYEIPLKMTPPGTYNGSSNSDREAVWPNDNMFDFPFELLTNLKLQRNREKQKGEGSGVSYSTPYSGYDPNKPMNKITVTGNPTLSEIKVIMIGVRNNSRYPQSTEIWLDEMRLTEFNEDGGWAGNANLYVALSDLGSVNFAGRKETAGFGSLDQGVMDRNLDDKQAINLTAQIEMGKFFPEKAKVSLPVYYSYRQEIISPKYNPLDQDILLRDALDAVETQAEKDSIRNFSIDKVVSRSFDINTLRANIVSKTPMPYDPANFTISYSSNENYAQNATTEYDRETDQRLMLSYLYSPPFKPWKPFAPSNSSGSSNTRSSTGNPSGATAKKFSPFLNEFEVGYLPKSIALHSDMTRNYFELQLRDLGNPGTNLLPASFREDFYWNRTLTIHWDLTKNLRFDLTTGTNARVNAPYVQVNKKLNLSDYELWKDSILTSIRNWGTPMEYNQQFSAVYELPFRNIPILNFMSGNLTYNAHYDWEKGAMIDDDAIELGNIITNERTMELNNFSFNLLNLYNKSTFLKTVNERFSAKPASSAARSTTRRSAAQQAAEAQRKKAANEQKKKTYTGSVQLNPDSATAVKHSLNNKRIRVTARGADGRTYAISYKTVDNNTINIHNKDSAKLTLTLTIAQLPPLDDLWWYKTAQAAARGAMLIRNFSFSYSQTQGAMIPGFHPQIGDFFGQTQTDFGTAPGLDFAFGLTDQSYLQKAATNNWLITDNYNNTTPAMFDRIENFTASAVVEPFAGMRIDVTANRQAMAQNQVDFMYAGMPTRVSGNFKMTTIALGTAFETSDASNGYASTAFSNFLIHRETLANRLEVLYTRQGIPGTVEPNSADALLPAFLAAYTGQSAQTVGTNLFPSLLKLLPNWNIKYDGLMRIPWFNKRFRSFTIEHKYTCTYAIGSYSSYSNWTEVSNGIGYIRNATTGQSTPSSPYNIAAANIVEAFDPLFGIQSVFLNNMNVKARYQTSRNINLNISSYQIIEITEKSLTAGLGYRIDHFNKIIHFPKKDNPSFNNYLTISADLSYRINQSVNRKLEDGFTQPTTGHSQLTAQFTADYTLSRLIGLQAFYDRQISRPLVSSASFPTSQSSFGVSIKINLLQ
jgi:cell surface protein SprA